MPGIHHILVPVDGSDSSANAARWAVGLAEQCDAVVTLVYVFPVTPAQRKDIEAEQPATLEAWRKEVAAEPFLLVDAALSDAGAQVKRVVLVGDPVQEITEFARKQRVSMVVMGSRGTSVLAGSLIGSLSIEVLHNTHVPVTIIH